MNDQIRESLSALMDGEANELELERVLKHSGDESLRASWTRFHAVRRVMGESVARQHLDVDVSAAVMSAIEDEDNPATQSPAGWGALVRPAASFAVAASVFAAVLIGSQFYGLVGTPGADVEPALADRVSTVGMVNTLGGSAVRAGYAAPAVREGGAQGRVDYNQLARQRLQRYLLSHTEEAALNTPQGMMPYARVATFQVEE